MPLILFLVIDSDNGVENFDVAPIGKLMSAVGSTLEKQTSAPLQSLQLLTEHIETLINLLPPHGCLPTP
jgi:hypothetical protein